MNLQPVSAPTTANNKRPDEARTRLHERWLVMARVVWAAVVVFALIIFIVSLPCAGYLAYPFQKSDNDGFANSFS